MALHWGHDDATQLTANLVDSLVEVGLVPPEDADEIVRDVLQQIILQVAIDIEPDRDPNTFPCNAVNKLITVAVLTTESFDALTVDPMTILFAGAVDVRVAEFGSDINRYAEDVDRDGDVDAAFQFLLGETELTCDSTEGLLTGATFDGSFSRKL